MAVLFQKEFLLVLLSFTLFKVSKANSVPPSCDISTSSGINAATANFFELDDLDAAIYNDINFLSGGYLPGNKIGGSLRNSDITWDSGPNGDIPPYGYTQNPIPLDRFLMDVTGFYKATLTGIYSIKANTNVNAATAVFMGAGSSFDCCDQYNVSMASDPIFTNALDQSPIPKEFYLEAGSYYPFRLIYANYGGIGALQISITLPDGSVDDTVGRNLYTYPLIKDDHCAAITHTFETTTHLETTAATSTYMTSVATTSTMVFTSSSTTEEAIITTVNTIVENSTTLLETSTAIETPIPSTSTLDTSASITEQTTIPEISTVIETPPPNTITSYITSGYTQATTFTITTYTIGPDGYPSPEYIIVIATPPPSAVTSYSSAPLTKETSIISVSTATDGSTIPETSTVTLYNSRSVTEETSSVFVHTTTDSNIIAETSADVETSSSPITSYTTDSVTETTPFTTLISGTDSSTISESNAITESSPSGGVITSRVLPNTSSSSGISYGNSTSQEPSSPVTSQEVPSPTTIQTVSGKESAAPTTTNANPVNTNVSPGITKTIPGNEPTAPAGNDGNTSDPGNEGSSNNSDDGSTSGTDNGSSSNDDTNNNASTPGNKGSSNNNDDGNKSDRNDEGSSSNENDHNVSAPAINDNDDRTSHDDNAASSKNSDDTSASGDKGHSNSGKNGDDSVPDNKGSSNNGKPDRDQNSMPGPLFTNKPYSSPTISIASSLSAYEGAGVLNKKWSLTSLLTVVILAIV